MSNPRYDNGGIRIKVPNTRGMKSRLRRSLLYSPPLRFLGGLKKVAISFIHQKADILLPETAASKQYLLDMGCRCGNSTVAPHGIDIGTFKPLRPDWKFAESIGLNGNELKNKLKILYAGGFNRHKGIDTIFDLLENDLLTEDMILIVPVNVEKNNKYRNKLKKHHNVKIIPQIKFEDMNKLYSLIDVTLVPSVVQGDTERSPNVIIEAMAAGKTVIASEIGGIPSIIGNAGILVAQKDPDEIATRLNELEKNRKLLKQYGRMARKHARRNLSAETYANTILKEYHKYTRSKLE